MIISLFSVIIGELLSVNTNNGSTSLKIIISCKLAVWLNDEPTIIDVSFKMLLIYLISLLTETLVPTEIKPNDSAAMNLVFISYINATVYIYGSRNSGTWIIKD